MIDRKTQNRILWAILIAYLFALVYFTVFAETMGRTPGGAEDELRYNLVLFREISRFWVYRRQLGMEAMMLNIFGNILAFLPCGYLLPRVAERCDTFLDMLLTGFLISFVIECTQFIFHVGSFDVDDLLLNTLGACLGYLLNRAVGILRQKHEDRLLADRCIRIREITFLDHEQRESA